MTSISRRIAAVIVVALFALLCGSSGTAASERTLVVRVYDHSPDTPELRAAAIRIAAAILAEAGVHADWRDCTGTADTACGGSRKPGDLIVRLMPGYGGGTPGARVSHDGAGDSRVALGFAVVEGTSGAGALATVFPDRVEPVAARNGVDPSALLGRAVAHEVGHLLLGTNRHSARGLMREIWTDAELTQNRPEDWVFTAPDQRRLSRLRK